ncbi:MAG: RagB/SusD family nutrient uptake outer membrane protein [Cytophagales bacterium]|nr:RagB/SusD family nutrient uptake outer membrane protein [Bernardetiaceae bacterium]MDW8204039.1 RagB/SusD family nutrient uptake outer membrane protein [Cytophagales bacterium]
MKNIQKCFFAVLFSMAIVGCQNVLNLEPRQSIDASRALNTPEAVNAAIINIYSYLKSQVIYGRDLVATTEALSDNSRIINRAGGRYVNQGNNVLGSHVGGWATYYSVINEINLVLEALPSVSLSDARRSEIEGELLALRALFYFNMMRIYAWDPSAIVQQFDKGGVPLMLTGIKNLSQITQPPRAPIRDVYQQIYRDLQEAVQKAPTTGGPHRITRGAAAAIFAKVALYNADWTNAARYATDAINANVGRLATNANYIAAWRERVHPESILEVLFQQEAESHGVNESNQSAFTTRVSLTSNSLGGWGAVVPTPEFLALHQSGDIRRQLYQTGVNRSNIVVEECTKFLGKTGTIYMDNVPVLRVSEMILIRAEAQARLGNLNQALADVNTIRTRCGLPPVAGLTREALIDEIILQRRLELAFEGDRWFDLKRLGRDVIKATGNLQFGDPRYLAPIPLRELQANPNLVQNNGY